MSIKNVVVVMATLMCCYCISMIEASKQFDAYRMLQFNGAANSAIARFGPQRSTLNAPSIGYLASLPLSAYSQATVVIADAEFTIDTLKALLDADVSGVVVLLSNSASSKSASSSSRSIGDMETVAALDIKVPVYFVRSEDFDASYLDGDYRLVVAGPTQTPITQTAVTNLAGIVRGQATEHSFAVPTILVVAHYDSFGAIPALTGTYGNEGASGVVALLELSRFFSKLYANAKNQGHHNVLFLLAGGSASNFEGTQRWLEQQPAIVTDAIEYVLCLDSIGQAGSDLFLHVSRPPKDNATRQLYGEFTAAATSFGAELHVVQKKINISNPYVYWEHEVFSRKKISAVTVSQRPTATQQQQQPVVVAEAPVDIATLKRNIKIVAKALISHIYHNERISSGIMSGVFDVNDSFLQSWIDSLQATTRMHPFFDALVPTNNNAGGEIGLVQGLERVMKNYLSEVTRDTVKLEAGNTNTYYQPAHVQMSFFHVKPFTFDLLVLGATVLYLLAIYVVIRGPSEAFKEVMSFVSPLTKSKSK
ncbi:hypothetical protein SAMD00019534_062490 [Acytostelium subglobosum LB1]|uniref:hypothetical protein n=1 Tax=Acytostelium subglobosum LB1 TaxID=1410327 RepID=UPI000644FAE6|nr:hypothetical protein SAMD00019534_062490 [Acytostelium subglobosum LB1]GAM23074.1 hypothetical protein SAMD00019534_062490 [Acytostelium subglobosum LB1]|eukprot:XP_012754301.1 hypothetical protein SAMD00019534_062490 [Acytostelium subglobosum LB1]